MAAALLAAQGGDDEETAPPPEAARTPAGADSPRARRERQRPPARGPSARLEPISQAAAGATGRARLTGGRPGRLDLAIEGLPKPRGTYEVWLYNSLIDAVSLGRFRTATIDLDARLPADPRRYRFLDVSMEPADRNRNHSGRSVMRVAVERLLRR